MNETEDVIHECEYGCGRPAVHQFKNGKWCCSDNQNRCPVIKERTKHKITYIPNSGYVCNYGCGRDANYQFGNGKWCCENHISKCAYRIDNVSRKFKHNKETIDKLREMKKRENLSEETLRKMSSWKRPDTLKEKLSEYSNNRPASHNENISKALTGKTSPMKGVTNRYSQETLKQMSESKKRENLSEETLRKMSFANSKANLSEESLKKYSEGSKKENLSDKTLSKMAKSARLRMIKLIESRLENGGQLTPNYNPEGCKLIDKMGIQLGLNFQHAMNGGEYHIKELGYWLDGYDKDNNVVIEIDESHHFDSESNLKEKDIQRQKEIEDCLECEFIRIKF